jgi:serine/threonine protein kinase
VRAKPSPSALSNLTIPSEILRVHKSYTMAVDMWSFGMIALYLTTGEVLVPNTDSQSSHTVILNALEEALYGIGSASHKVWWRASAPARDFILKLLTLSEEERMTSKQALEHPWIAAHHLKQEFTYLDNRTVRYWDPKPNNDLPIVELAEVCLLHSQRRVHSKYESESSHFLPQSGQKKQRDASSFQFINLGSHLHPKMRSNRREILAKVQASGHAFIHSQPPTPRRTRTAPIKFNTARLKSKYVPGNDIFGKSAAARITAVSDSSNTEFPSDSSHSDDNLKETSMTENNTKLNPIRMKRTLAK